jgi:hypothetical protein
MFPQKDFNFSWQGKYVLKIYLSRQTLIQNLYFRKQIQVTILVVLIWNMPLVLMKFLNSVWKYSMLFPMLTAEWLHLALDRIS